MCDERKVFLCCLGCHLNIGGSLVRVEAGVEFGSGGLGRGLLLSRGLLSGGDHLCGSLTALRRGFLVVVSLGRLLQPRESGRDGRVDWSAADDGDAQRATVELDTVVSSDGALRLGVRGEFNFSGTLASTVRAVVDSRLDDSSDLGEEFLRMVAAMRNEARRNINIQMSKNSVARSKRVELRRGESMYESVESVESVRERDVSVCLVCLSVHLNRTNSETNSKKSAPPGNQKFATS